MDMLFEIAYFLDVRIVLVVDIVGHEVDGLEAPLDLTQIHSRFKFKTLFTDNN